MLASINRSPGQAGSTTGHSDKELHRSFSQEQKKQHNPLLETAGEDGVPNNIHVIRFHAWQDLTVAHNGDAPLYATVTIEMSNKYYLNLNGPSGVIKIEDPNGEVLVEGQLLVNQAHYGLGLSKPGTRQVQFAMTPLPMYGRLDNLDTVRGSARLRIGERLVTVRLPETHVIFTR